MVTRTAVAGVASIAILLTACGQPPVGAGVDPVATPAPATTPAGIDPAAPPPEATPTTEPTESTQPSPSPSQTLKASSTPTATKSTTPKPTQEAGPAILGQGNQSDRVKELQARLSQVGWFSGTVTGYYGPETSAAVRGFQGKRGLPVNGSVDQTTWNRLVSMTRKPTADELSNKPKADPAQSGKKAEGLPAACMSGRVICISKRSNRLWWVNNGSVIMSMDVRFGADEYPTREGTFSVQWKSRDHVSNIYHTAMPYALFFSGGQAVHYSPDFAARGYRGGSHGCVNLRNKSGAQSLFNSARVGDKVYVYS